MSVNRVTQIGKQVVSGITTGTLVTQIGKQVSFPVHNDTHITQIGKQVVWSGTGTASSGDSGGGNPVPPQIAPAAIQARGGTLYVDSALEYDGRNVGTGDGLFPGVTVALSGGSTWLPGETLTLTSAPRGVFLVGDVGNVLVLHQTDGVTGDTITTVRFTIVGYTSATVVTGTADIAIPTGMRSGLINVWDRLVDEVAGLDHLEGEAVGILGDEHVIASPYNARLPIVKVTAGAVPLGDFYARVIVGLPYFSDIETLDVDQPSGPSIKGQNVNITRVGVYMDESRPVWTGGAPPTNDAIDPLEALQEIPLPTDKTYETYITKYVNANIPSNFTESGRVFIRSVDPVAARVLAIIAHGYRPGPG